MQMYSNSNVQKNRSFRMYSYSSIRKGATIELFETFQSEIIYVNNKHE